MEEPPPCDYCSQPATSVCATCQTFTYCSTECQAHDWHGGHFAECIEPHHLQAWIRENYADIGKDGKDGKIKKWAMRKRGKHIERKGKALRRRGRL